MAKRKREWPPVGTSLEAPVVDNHTHLPVHEGEIPSPGGVRPSLEEQIGWANEVRVTRMISSACSLPDFQPMLQIGEDWPEVKVALAIHPNEAALHSGILEKGPDGLEHHMEAHHVSLLEALSEVSRHLSHPEVIAVGETGLDYFRTGEAGREAQKESFRAHLEMALAHDLPVQIHDRDAHEDTVEILKDMDISGLRVVFHCFSGDQRLANEIAENGWFASFAGPLTYPANDDLRRAFLCLPPDRILVETDAPYLTPVPYRGCPNGSYVMPYTVRYMADLWGVSEGEAINRLNLTTERVYGIW